MTPVKKYQAAQFHAMGEHALPAGGNGELLRFIHLASVGLGMEFAQDDAIATVMGSMTRSIDIGGIVLDYGLALGDPLDADAVNPLNNDFLEHWEILTDRISSNTSTGNPEPDAVSSWSPFSVQWPVQTLNAATDFPNDSTEQYRFPVRTHWQKTHYRTLAPLTMDTPNENTLYFSPETPTLPRNSTLNRRLKLRLDDQQGLFLCLATRNSPTFDAGSNFRTLRYWCRGTLYYRVVR